MLVFHCARTGAAIISGLLVLTFGTTVDAAADVQVKSVTSVADPCDVSRERMKKVGGTLLGTVVGFGVCRLATQILDPNSRTSTKNRISAGCAVAGGIVGYTRSADSARRACEVAQIARRNQLAASFEEVTVTGPAPAPAAAPQPAPPAGGSAAPADQSVIAVTTFAGLGHFESGSSTLTPQARQYFHDVALQYTFEGQRASLQHSLTQQGQAQIKPQDLEQLKKDWSEIRIVLVGHTDDTGSDALNAELSERRAHAVAEVFRDAGVAADKLYYQGAGSSLPIGDNHTEDGRAQNRRVEVIELPAGADVAGYLALRHPNPDLLRPLPAKAAVAAPSAPALPPPRKSSPADEWTDQLPAQAKRPPAAAAPATAGIDFGGSPAEPRNQSILTAMGPPAGDKSDWGFVRAAVASEEPIYAAPCTRDDPALDIGLPVKQLSTGAAVYRTNEYLPGFNDAAWLGTVNGQGVGLNHVAILREGNAPVRDPQVLVYRDFQHQGPSAPAFSADSKVKVYIGQKGLLYRIFVQRPTLRCLDVVVPAGGALDATAGALYYDSLDRVYAAAYVPARVQAQ